MSNRVGTKGQVVIEKGIRDRLGVEPGWRAVQLLVDDHVELYFIPPEHDRSVAGALSKYARANLRSEEALKEAAEAAWVEAVRERFGTPDTSE